MLLIAMFQLAAVATAPNYINTSSVIVNADVEDAPDAELRVWRLTAEGWTPIEAQTLRPGVARVESAGDGEYALFVAVQTPTCPAKPPTSADAPQALFIVDTRSPTLQIHNVRPPRPGECASPRGLVLEMSLLEEHLDPQGARLYWRATGSGPWSDGGSITPGSGTIIWQAPNDAPRRVDVMVMAVDQAGNRASDTWVAALIRDPVANNETGATAINRDTASKPASPQNPNDIDDDESTLESPEPPVTPIPLTTPLSDPRVERLRRLAREHANRGQMSLAAARLEDALSLDPAEPELLAELGTATLKLGKFDNAESRFSAALACDPQHVPSIEGLALVAVSQNRYDAARSRLLELLSLQPQSGETWLRYGDVENKLGNLEDARQAWRHAAENAKDRALRDKAQKRLRLFADPPKSN